MKVNPSRRVFPLVLSLLAAPLSLLGCASDDALELEMEEVSEARQELVMGTAGCGDRVRLRSWKGDYLHRPDIPQGVTTWASGIGNVWTIDCLANGNVQLRSWKGDYLHRPDSPQGVTTWSNGEWTVVPTAGGRFMLMSWKGDYLHRPDGPEGVTTWSNGEWTAETVVLGDAACNDQVRLKSWRGDYLSRTDIDGTEPRVNASSSSHREVWTVECASNGKVQLRSWKGDYLHRPDSPQGVTTWGFGEWTVENHGATVSLRSWKNDYLHRPDGPTDVITTWDQGEWTVEALPSAALVAKFAPRLRFDGAAPNYPMSAQSFYDQAVAVPQSYRVDNTDYGLVAGGNVPTYYQITSCGNQTRIMYWWFYGYQHTCDGVSGAHNGDWENVMVTLTEDQSSIAAVTFYAHGDRYTRLASRGGFQIEDGSHPVVYVGKAAHGGYNDQGGSGSCLFWEDYRNNWNGSHMDSWQNLVSLNANEPWMIADRSGGFSWGNDGVNTHPTQSGPTCYVNACDWSDWGAAGAMGHTQCKAGDDDTGVECIEECRSGYTNMGLTCSMCSGDWWDPTSWYCDTYSRGRYGYDYPIPTSDSGLLSSDGG